MRAVHGSVVLKVVADSWNTIGSKKSRIVQLWLSRKWEIKKRLNKLMAEKPWSDSHGLTLKTCLNLTQNQC